MNTPAKVHHLCIEPHVRGRKIRKARVKHADEGKAGEKRKAADHWPGDDDLIAAPAFGGHLERVTARLE